MKEDNHFKMRKLNPEGPYVLGDEECTSIRTEYLRRGNNILASYTTVATTSNIGMQEITKHIKNDETPMRLTLGSRLIQCQLQTLKKLMPDVLRQLTNQWTVIVYGNFEAYLVDLLIGAFQAQKIADPEQESLRMLATRAWEGKIDNIGQRLKVNLGKRRFAERFKEVKLEFQGISCKDPIAFLQKTADIRHLITHSSGRISESLAKDFPDTGLKAGDKIQMPVEFPFDLHIFLVAFSDVFDIAFSEVYSWKRELISPKSLI
jgi:hypothetical protein